MGIDLSGWHSLIVTVPVSILLLRWAFRCPSCGRYRHKAAEVRTLREYVDAHQAVEHLIVDHTDDRAAYNAAVERFNAAAQALQAGGHHGH
jgi:hypothetical protein